MVILWRLIIGVLVYLVHSACAYRLIRAYDLRMGRKWTIGLRKTALLLAITPIIGLVVGVLLWFDFEDQGEATW